MLKWKRVQRKISPKGRKRKGERGAVSKKCIKHSARVNLAKWLTVSIQMLYLRMKGEKGQWDKTRLPAACIPPMSNNADGYKRELAACQK